MCVEETQANGTVTMQGEEVANVDDLNYLLESDGGEEKKRSREYSMMEWLDKNDRRLPAIHAVKGKGYKVAV